MKSICQWRSILGMEPHPRPGWMRLNSSEKGECKCQGCQVTVEGLDFVNHVQTPPRKGERTRKISFLYNIEVTPTTGPADGRPLLKMFKTEEESPYCTSCFHRTDPQLFKDVNFSLLGKINVVDVSDDSLPSVNNMFLRSITNIGCKKIV